MFYTYFLLFLCYSVAGWIMEFFYTLITEKKAINRGFLIGPYCPIYGVGCLLLITQLSKYQNTTWELFALTIFICSLVEYITSFLMEKIFKMRWWDYSDMRFNINGRICLETMVPFAIIGSLVIKYINPFFLSIINLISPTSKSILTTILLSLFIVDIIISCKVIINLKNVTKNLRKDSTEEINKAVKKAIRDNTSLYTRIIKAFPKMTKIIKRKTKQATNFILNKKDNH